MNSTRPPETMYVVKPFCCKQAITSSMDWYYPRPLQYAMCPAVEQIPGASARTRSAPRQWQPLWVYGSMSRAACRGSRVEAIRTLWDRNNA